MVQGESVKAQVISEGGDGVILTNVQPRPCSRRVYEIDWDLTRHWHVLIDLPHSGMHNELGPGRRLSHYGPEWAESQRRSWKLWDYPTNSRYPGDKGFAYAQVLDFDAWEFLVNVEGFSHTVLSHMEAPDNTTRITKELVSLCWNVIYFIAVIDGCGEKAMLLKTKHYCVYWMKEWPVPDLKPPAGTTPGDESNPCEDPSWPVDCDGNTRGPGSKKPTPPVVEPQPPSAPTVKSAPFRCTVRVWEWYDYYISRPDLWKKYGDGINEERLYRDYRWDVVQAYFEPLGIAWEGPYWDEPRVIKWLPEISSLTYRSGLLILYGLGYCDKDYGIIQDCVRETIGCEIP